MSYNPNRALAVLRQGTGRADSVFREGQEEAIRHVVDGRGRLLVVQKTGWGKSVVYFIATKLLRESVVEDFEMTACETDTKCIPEAVL